MGCPTFSRYCVVRLYWLSRSQSPVPSPRVCGACRNSLSSTVEMELNTCRRKTGQEGCDGKRMNERGASLRYLRPPVHRDQRQEGAQVRKSKMKEESLEEKVETPVAITAKRLRICRDKQHRQLLLQLWPLFCARARL